MNRMSVAPVTRLATLAALLLLVSTGAQAQWSPDPAVNLAVCDTAGSQELPKIAATSDGGCYVSWFDTRGGAYRVYLQRLNAGGVKQWGENGLLVSANPQNSSLVDYDLAVDDSNCAVVVFTDIRSGGQIEPFAYRINPQGVFLWGANGVALSTSSSTSQPNPKVVATSDGSYVFAWIYTSSPRKIALQRLNAAGVKQWGTDPILLAGTGTENLDYPSIVRSDAGSVILMMSGYTGTFISPQNYRLYTQKYSPAGTPLWGSVPDTVYALGRVSGFFVPKLIPDGNNGAFYVWHDDRNSTGSSFSHVQHITAANVKLFPVNGSAGSTSLGRLHNDAWVGWTPLTGETYMFWYETDASTQSAYGVYGQKFSASGVRQWPDSGKAFRPFGGGQPSFIRCAGKDSSAVVFYLDGITTTTGLVKGFRTDRNGNFLWSGSIINVSSVASGKGRLGGAFLPDGTSLLAWADKRSDANGIYGQNAKLDGSLGAPTRIPAGTVSGTWTRAASPYFIDGDISVASGTTLTIQPGVRVLFTGHFKCDVFGRVLAVGTAADTVVFTAQNTATGWHGLRFFNTNLRPADSSKLVYCRFEYGRAVGATNPEKEGGAIRLENSSNVVIDRCWFRYNYADNDGGAVIALAGSNILIDNSLFTANRAYFYGGAFMCRASRPLIRNSVFLNDSVTIFGAGVSGWDNSVLRLENVRIANCQAGAACGIYTANNTTITVVNALLTGNSSTLGYGGGAGFSVSTATLINVTMANNTAAQGGGAAWIYQSTASVTNSIAWGNLPTTFDVNTSTLLCTYSDVQGGYTGTGNINVDPAFVGSGAHPFALQETSPCRDAANPDTTGLQLPRFDLAGNPRVIGARVDMGAYEVQSAPPTPGWVTQTSGVTTPLNTVKAVNQNIAWAAGNGGRVLKTVNSGSTWTPVGGGRIGTGDIYAVEAVDAATALVTTTPTTTTYLFRTTNGGATWDTVYRQAGGFLDAIRMFDATSGIALGDPVGGKWTIIKTSDGGATWVRDTANAPVQVGSEAGSNNGLAALSPSAFWFPSNSTPPKVYRTTNGGGAWSSPALPFSATFTSGIAFNSASTGVVGANNGSAARTTDGGATWSAVTIGSGTGAIYGITGSGVDFFATKGADVYRSTDRGSTWASSLTGTAGTLNHISFATAGSSTRGWAVSATGGIAAFYGVVTGVGEEAAEIPRAFALEQNYPNPFNPSTTLRYALPQASWVRSAVYNLLGQQVAALHDGIQAAGQHQLVWNGRDDYGSPLASGVYFCRIEATPVDGGRANTGLVKLLLMK